MCLRGLGIVQDKPKGIDLLRRAVLSGSIQAAAGLGEHYYRMRASDLALPMLEMAADGGHARSMALLGDLLQTSSFIHEDDKELAQHRGFAWLKKSADLGDAWGLNSLGVVVWDGEYPSFTEHRDTITASKYFQKSADQDWSGGEVNYGLSHLEIAVENPDFQLAYRMFQRAAEQGAIEGFLNLGIQLLRGQGVKQDRAAALANFKTVAEYAAVEHRAGAEGYLGALYAEGKGNVVQDFKESNYWFKKANEDSRDPEIEMLVGCQYLAGLGVSQDPALAKQWLTDAAEGGNEHGWRNLKSKSKCRAFLEP